MNAAVQLEPAVDVNTEEAVLLADELSDEAHDSNEGALAEALLSVDSEP